MGNSQQHQLDETIDEIYYSLPKSKSKFSTESLVLSGGGSRSRWNSASTRIRASHSRNNSRTVCPMNGNDAEIEDEMDESVLSTTEAESTKIATHRLLSISISDQLIDALNLNFLLTKSTESPKDSDRMSDRMSSSSYSSSSSEMQSLSSSFSPAQSSSPIPTPPLSPRESKMTPTILSSLNFAEMGGSMLSRDIAWDILFQRYITDELEAEERETESSMWAREELEAPTT